MDVKEKEIKYQGNAGHRERLRKRFLKDGLEDYEKLELLLTYAIARRDVKPMAKALINKFKNIYGVIEAPVEQLTKIDGMGENSAIIIKLIKELINNYFSEKMQTCEVSVSSLDLVIDYAKTKIGSLKDEAVMVIYLNVKNRVIDQDITYGVPDQAPIYLRKIMESAIWHKAAGLILVHNHPSGDCKPSLADEKLTAAACNLGKTMNIKLVDHLIISRDDCFSFARDGRL